MKLTKYELDNLEKFEKSIIDGKFSNESLVQFIELSAMYLNLQTIPNYCKSNKISYNGAKRYRTVKEIIGVKFIIDNE